VTRGACLTPWRHARALLGSALACLALGACAKGADPAAFAPSEGGAAGEPGGPELALPYATRVVSFEPGEGAGFGEASLPDIVLGPPTGKGTNAGSLDVLSLGKGGSIVLAFDGHPITDGDGPDLVVFENAFWPGGAANAVYAEPGEVSVSEDGEHWQSFACDAKGDGEGHFDGCAGVTPTLEYDAEGLLPLEPALTGGDAFDLADLGLESANFVRVRDVSDAGDTPTAGFDLDAVGVVSSPPGDEP
jgi:hypothetical protein